jgi:hypothetical protein
LKELSLQAEEGMTAFEDERGRSIHLVKIEEGSEDMIILQGSQAAEVLDEGNHGQ